MLRYESGTELGEATATARGRAACSDGKAGQKLHVFSYRPRPRTRALRKSLGCWAQP